MTEDCSWPRDLGHERVFAGGINCHPATRHFFAPQRVPRSVRLPAPRSQLPAICLLTSPVKIPPEQDNLSCETFVPIAANPLLMGLQAGCEFQG
jgi:hypothetical protein